jgi:hypothetical protein
LRMLSSSPMPTQNSTGSSIVIPISLLSQNSKNRRWATATNSTRRRKGAQRSAAPTLVGLARGICAEMPKNMWHRPGPKSEPCRMILVAAMPSIYSQYSGIRGRACRGCSGSGKRLQPAPLVGSVSVAGSGPAGASAGNCRKAPATLLFSLRLREHPKTSCFNRRWSSGSALSGAGGPQSGPLRADFTGTLRHGEGTL